MPFCPLQKFYWALSSDQRAKSDIRTRPDMESLSKMSAPLRGEKVQIHTWEAEKQKRTRVPVWCKCPSVGCRVWAGMPAY